MNKEREPRPFKLTLEEITQRAKELILEGGEHPTTILVEGDQEVAGIVVDMAPTHDERMVQMYATGVFLAETGKISELRQVYYIAEGWMSLAQVDKPLPYLPSRDPNRKEVLVVSNLQAADNKTTLVTFEMIRDKVGRLVELKELHQTPSADTYAESPLLVAFATGFSKGKGDTVH